MMKIKALGIVAAVFAASSLLIAGCGGKTAERVPAPGALQGPQDAQDVVTECRRSCGDLRTGGRARRTEHRGRRLLLYLPLAGRRKQDC